MAAMPRSLLILVRIGLVLAVVATGGFYAIVASHSPPEVWHYAFYEPLGVRLFVFDVLAICHLGYLLWLAVTLRRRQNPLIPWAISAGLIVAVPYLLMGDSAVFLRFCRFGAFRAGYPLAMASLTLWAAVWAVRRARRRGAP
jgi:hypothetical protein